MSLNQIGKIVAEEWLKSAEIRQEIELDKWIIMPNHVHGLVLINQNFNDTSASFKGTSLVPLQDGKDNDQTFKRRARSLSSFIGGFKSAVTQRIKLICECGNPVIWQRNYYETIIRNEQQLYQIRQYILNNPQQWQEDPEKPDLLYQELLIEFLF